MRVLVVTTWFPSRKAPSSGAFVVKDVQAIRAEGVDVRLIHLVNPKFDDGDRQFVYEGIPVIRIPYSPLNPLHAMKAADIIRQYSAGADLVHSMAISSLPATMRVKKPWVHTEHWSGLTNPDTRSSTLNAVMPIVRSVLKKPDFVTAVCEYLAQPIREIRGERAVGIVPCIVPAADEIVEPVSVEEAGELRMVTVGGLIKRKNPMMALDVTEELLRRGVNARMIFVGEGPLREEIEKRASQGTLRGHVTLTGNLNRAGVVESLNDSHVFLGPTNGDNFFVSCAESIAQGRPVVVSDKGGQGEYVRPVAGRVLSDATAQEYADAVQEVVGSASAQQIADSIGDAFHPHSVGRGYREVYESLVGGLV
ncbi:glycosyltransferase family 4 protein [Flaviflexus massiliensis]|uniref:glycosyltransferase family 4 protein n=1 Tax=Flaviflexus massiliensis TaxID=1522309 RepID=UPI0006D586F5|nr:glycosyltransferase family 4 protein [Flaviflexus massiliensis]